VPGEVFELVFGEVYRVFAHGQVDEVDARFSQDPGRLDDLVVAFSVPKGIWVGFPEETKMAVVAAVGAQVYEPVEEYPVSRLLVADPPGRGEESLSFLLLSDGEEADEFGLRKGIPHLGPFHDWFEGGVRHARY